MMTLPSEMDEIWSQFLKKWPLDRLRTMSLHEYAKAGDQDCFTYWVETRLKKLGSIQGGTALKFGIYAQADVDKVGTAKGGVYAGGYGWRDKWGSTSAAAFEAVRLAVVQVAEAATAGDFDQIENSKLAPMYRWRLAFLYQDRASPRLFPIYATKALRAIAAKYGMVGAEKASHVALCTKLLAVQGDRSMWEFAQEIWDKHGAEFASAPFKKPGTPVGMPNDDDDEEEDEILVQPVSTGKVQRHSQLNTILFGPPGTGKTYNTIDEALSILDPQFLAGRPPVSLSDHAAYQQRRSQLKLRFDELVTEGRISFVTFHQSFSYEDFVEGLRAVMDDDRAVSTVGLQYRVEPGVFQRLCTAARRDAVAEKSLGVGDDARIWKLSIGRAGENPTRHYCYTHGEARVGWDQVGDLRTADLDAPEHGLGSNDRNSLNTLLSVAVGDVIVCIRSINSVGGIGVVTGEYRHDPTPPAGVSPDYVHVLPVRWLATDLDLDIRAINGGLSFTQKTLYPLDRFKWSELAELMAKAGLQVAVPAPSSTQTEQPYVLIIDEINRGNVSRIFGELITLIEPSKRAGAAEALSVTLPYSKKAFSVPGNVFLLGTMNTADRSLAGLDIALRRRFTFKEMAPQPDLLHGVVVDGVDVGELLAVMNERIEVLLDRDHKLGHAYFMRLAEPGGNRLAALAQVFRGNVLPLLQEYFFEDWERIALVLNDLRKPEGRRFVYRPESNLDNLFGSDQVPKLTDRRWQIDEQAFEHIETYQRILA